jgi:hypothetical protein
LPAADAAARADLDHIGTSSNQLAHLLAHLLGPIDDVVRLAGMVDADDARHVRAARLPRIAVTAGLAEDRDGDLHVGPWREPALLRRLHPEIAATCLANGRDASGKCPRHPFGGQVEVQRERGLHRLHRVEVTVDHEVHVTVDEARIDGVAGRVDCVVPIQ